MEMKVRQLFSSDPLPAELADCISLADLPLIGASPDGQTDKDPDNDAFCSRCVSECKTKAPFRQDSAALALGTQLTGPCNHYSSALFTGAASDACNWNDTGILSVNIFTVIH